jgi:hypothetical protein
MTTANIGINPALQTAFAGSFFVSSEGYTQGDALDDPAIRFSLRRGIVISTATVPMWGGLAISETLPSGTVGVGSTSPSGNLQSILAPATSASAGAAGCLTGFTVFNQATAMVQTAQSRVPVAGSNGAINFYRLGSKARIPLNTNPTAASAWSGGVTDPQTIYWDTTNLWLTNASGSGIIGPFTTITIDAINLNNSRIVSYSSGTGFASWTENGACTVVVI